MGNRHHSFPFPSPSQIFADTSMTLASLCVSGVEHHGVLEPRSQRARYKLTVSSSSNFPFRPSLHDTT